MNKSFVALVLLAGCSSQGVNRSAQNTLIKEFYASLDSVEEVKLSSNVKTGIVGGAAVGVIDEADGNSEDMIAGAIAGALVGGLFTAIFEGDDKAYQYTLNSVQEGKFALIQKERIDTNTGCVKVTVRKETFITSAPKINCQFN